MIFYYTFSKGDERVKVQGEGKDPLECSNVSWTASDDEILKMLQSVESDYHPRYNVIKYEDYQNNLYAQINKFGRLIKYGYRFKDDNLPELENKPVEKMEDNFEYIMDLEKLEGEIGEDVIVAGIASTGSIDHDGEKIDMDSLHEQWGSYMTNPVIRFMHGKDSRNPDAIGKVIPEYTNTSGKTFKTEFTDKGPYIVVKISNAPDTESIRTKIKEGVLKGFSIGGRAQRVKEYDHGLGKDVNRVVVKRLSEISIVDLPANKDGFYEVVKMACTGPNCPLMKETEEVKIITESNDIIKIEIDLDVLKTERGTHKEPVKITRGGKTFYQQRMVGKKDVDASKKKRTAKEDGKILGSIWKKNSKETTVKDKNAETWMQRSNWTQEKEDDFFRGLSRKEHDKLISSTLKASVDGVSDMKDQYEHDANYAMKLYNKKYNTNWNKEIPGQKDSTKKLGDVWKRDVKKLKDTLSTLNAEPKKTKAMSERIANLKQEIKNQETNS